jgi:pilus assembly protein CpaC
VLGKGDPTAGISSFNSGIFGSLRVLEQTGMVRTLAEPTLTAISGEAANFLAGGEFPVPTGRDKDGNVTITYKPFGVGLTFTPVVLAEGRISLHVKTEVSELSTENAIQLSGVTLPAVVVRRSESTMELPSGGAMVMGGLLQDNIRETISGIPALQKLPVLGALFRSRDFKRNETELVIIVTPYLVKPVPRTALARPDDGFNLSSDGTTDFLGRINRVYGVKGKPAPAGSYAGKYGFIFE